MYDFVCAMQFECRLLISYVPFKAVSLWYFLWVAFYWLLWNEKGHLSSVVVLYDYSVGSSGCAAFLPSFLTRIIYEPSCDPLNTYYWMSLGLSATAVPLSLYISLSYFLFLLYVTYSYFYARDALDLAASFFDCLFCGSRRYGQVPHIKPALS